MYAFISDISDPEMVGFRLGMVQVVALLGVPIGAMLGGYINEAGWLKVCVVACGST